MGKPSVVVEGLSKKFGLSLRAALKYGMVDAGRRIFGRANQATLRAGEFWALQDVSFELAPGESLGIMGVNGSGKTTLLRILNGSYSPDLGQVTLRGRTGALIAAGAGFSPMLSGRENVFVSAALLGMSPRETRKRFDEIVAFAGLEEFIDMPVRNYSSGMSVRLGFAIAVLGAPEVLLVDEVLAVGDLSFQKKCYEKIYSLQRGGTTILLVSHSPGAIWAICTKALVLHKGRSSGVVPVEEACKLYDQYNMFERMQQQVPTESGGDLPGEYGGLRGGTGDALITKVEVLDENQKFVTSLPYGETFIVRCYLDIHARMRDAIVRMQVDAEINKGIVILDSYEAHGQVFDLVPGKGHVDIRVRSPRLRPGTYSFSGSLLVRRAAVHVFFEYDQARLMITHPSDSFFYADFRSSYQPDVQYSGSFALASPAASSAPAEQSMATHE